MGPAAARIAALAVSRFLSRSLPDLEAVARRAATRAARGDVASAVTACLHRSGAAFACAGLAAEGVHVFDVRLVLGTRSARHAGIRGTTVLVVDRGQAHALAVGTPYLVAGSTRPAGLTEPGGRSLLVAAQPLALESRLLADSISQGGWPYDIVLAPHPEDGPAARASWARMLDGTLGPGNWRFAEASADALDSIGAVATVTSNVALTAAARGVPVFLIAPPGALRSLWADGPYPGLDMGGTRVAPEALGRAALAVADYVRANPEIRDGEAGARIAAAVARAATSVESREEVVKV
jgi:hypothetical protein